MAETIYIGAMFKSFFDFNEVFKEYCKRTHQVFVMQKSVKIQNANRKTVQTPLGKPHYAEQLVYAYILYGCVRGGVHKSSSKGIRKTTSHKSGCEAMMYVRGDREKGILEIRKLVTDHNHPIGPDVTYRKADRIRKNPQKKKDQAQQSSGRTVGVTELQTMVKSVIPPLTNDLHKGQAGRIGIIGGCQEYTGAPYFSAITALKVGADLAHVFCTKEAAPVIKSYSPELIVHPILDHVNALAEFEKWLPRLHTLVVGPGLGRDTEVLKTVSSVIQNCKARGIPLVIDADGLFLITESPELVVSYTNTVLTPNVVEFQRLFDKMIGERPGQNQDLAANTKLLAQCMGNLTILQKGSEDIISDGNTVIMCSTDGCPRRCGGQGDLLSGSTGVFYNWAVKKSADGTAILGPGVLAGYMACRLIRECSRRAFTSNGRSMVASDLIPHIHQSFDDIFV
ncbi:ATP-dependent (S)-NAD(P)H-hydrate dehydratase-like isoform X2 [Littorina saxatilis]|uniref:ATP-dependent (S)-NAD(P)H-hydrate dehydratase n=1 Tax=Littorina saxatilis TaxID=31220 RepID=A0AAN9B1M2_9CAEN